MEIRLVKTPIAIDLVTKLAQEQFGNIIKATVDIEKSIMALGGDLHADEEKLLLDEGSEQKNLWGINLYPANFGKEDFIEFDSMINLRPSQGNMSRGVEDKETQKQIIELVNRLVTK